MADPAPPIPADSRPLPPYTNDIAMLVVHGIIEEQLTANTFFYRTTETLGSITVADMSNLIGMFMAPGGPGDAMQHACTKSWHLEKITCTCVNNTQLQAAEQAIGIDGVNDVPHLPTTVCVTIARYSIYRGKCGRGRISVPAVPSTWATLSTLTDQSAHQALATTMKAVLHTTGTDFIPGIYSKGPAVHRVDGWADIIKTVIRPILGTCRRRKLFRGV